MAFVHCHLGSHVGDVLASVVKPLDAVGCMLLVCGEDEKVIGEDPGHNMLCSHHKQPGSHEEPDHRHRERAALGNRAPMVVWLPNVVAYLVVGEKVFLENHIGIQYAFGHASFVGEGVDQRPYHLFEAFVNVDAGSCDWGVVGSMVLHF